MDWKYSDGTNEIHLMTYLALSFWIYKFKHLHLRWYWIYSTTHWKKKKESKYTQIAMELTYYHKQNGLFANVLVLIKPVKRTGWWLLTVSVGSVVKLSGNSCKDTDQINYLHYLTHFYVKYEILNKYRIKNNKLTLELKCWEWKHQTHHPDLHQCIRSWSCSQAVH